MNPKPSPNFGAWRKRPVRVVGVNVVPASADTEAIRRFIQERMEHSKVYDETKENQHARDHH